MKRLLLTCAAATAVMLTACIDVDLAGSAAAVDGGRVTQTTGVSNASQDASQTTPDPHALGEEPGAGAHDPDASVSPSPLRIAALQRRS